MHVYAMNNVLLAHIGQILDGLVIKCDDHDWHEVADNCCNGTVILKVEKSLFSNPTQLVIRYFHYVYIKSI